jgi:hypothetical protein
LMPAAYGYQAARTAIGTVCLRACSRWDNSAKYFRFQMVDNHKGIMKKSEFYIDLPLILC